MQSVSCACGKSYQAKPQYAGKKIGCPACGQAIQFPAASTPAKVGISVRCGCGKSLALKPEMAGKKIRCPSCQGVMKVPGNNAAPTGSPAQTGIAVRCGCGKGMKLKPDMAGKKVRCPSCQGVVPVPGRAAPTAPAPFQPMKHDPLGMGGVSDPFASNTNQFAAAPAQPMGYAAPAPRQRQGKKGKGRSKAGKGRRSKNNVRRGSSSPGWLKSTALALSNRLECDSMWALVGWALLGLAFTIALPFASVHTISTVLDAHASATWPTTSATISSAKVESTRRGRRIKRTYYYPSVTYDFKVDGKSYKGDRISWRSEESSNSGDIQSLISQAFPRGAQYTIHYDPDDPSNAIIDPSFSYGVYFRLILPLICLMGPPLLFFYGLAAWGRKISR